MSAKVVKIRDASERSETWSDEAVAVACSTGDGAAVAELFDRYQEPVARFLSRMIGPSEDVEDLTQATFLEIARGAARFEGRSAVRTWIFGIAANVARHHLRSLARRGRLSRAIAFFSSDQATTTRGTSVVAETRQTLRRISQAMEKLPVEQREAFVMCELEGLSAREAAQALGASEAVVWKRVSRARKALRKVASEEAS